MNKLKAGFGRVNINPELGAPLAGYVEDRFTQGYIDNLEANALALSLGDAKLILVSLDNIGMRTNVLDSIRKEISDEQNIPFENILIGCTHTHTGPLARLEAAANYKDNIVEKYVSFVGEKIKEATALAINDLTDAKMGYGVGKAERITFNRRYLMKDGTIRTNPGVNNPEIDSCLGEVDETVPVLRFDRADGKHLILFNFATHADVVGGSNVSADWPGLARKTIEKVIDNSQSIFFNGTEGDQNHVNVHPVGGDFNDMFIDFDDVSRGYEHARHMGYVVAGSVMQCYQKVQYVDVDKISAIEKIINVPANTATPEQIKNAYKIREMHLAGRDDELPFKGMMLTTAITEANRMIRLEHGPDSFEMPMTGIKLGPVAFVSIPGEGFVKIGIELKKNPNYDLVIPLGITNGAQGYYPMMENFTEGGYEAACSNFRAGVAEQIINTGNELINSLI